MVKKKMDRIFKTIIVYTILMFLISSCTSSKHISYNLYTISEDTAYIYKSKYLDMEIAKNKTQLYTPLYYEIEVLEIDTFTGFMEKDSILYNKRLVRDFFWKKSDNCSSY